MKPFSTGKLCAHCQKGGQVYPRLSPKTGALEYAHARCARRLARVIERRMA